VARLRAAQRQSRCTHLPSNPYSKFSSSGPPTRADVQRLKALTNLVNVCDRT
jgi:hypothetical protein